MMPVLKFPGLSGYGAIRAARNLAAALLIWLSPAVAAAEVTIAALGDSLVHGYGLAPEDGFVPQLDRWLENEGVEARILNAGVSGDTTQGGRARVDWTLTPEVDALIVVLGGNDLLRGIDPGVVRANLDAILAAAAERQIPVLLSGMSAPGNYGADYKAAFDTIYPDLATAHGAILYPDFLGPLASLEDREDARRRFMQPDGLHPNAQGVARIVEAMGPSVVTLIGRATD